MSLVVIDGIDRTGKSTCARNLVAELRRRNSLLPKPMLYTEPAEDSGGSTGCGQPGVWVRCYLRAKAGGYSAAWQPETWICAFVGAMLAQDAEARAMLATGRDVIYVRRELSTFAYQCFGALEIRQQPSEILRHRVSFVALAVLALAPPDLTILLDGDPEKLAARGAGERRDNVAYETIEEQRRLRAAYREAVEDPRVRSRLGKLAVIDAEQSAEAVLAAALRAVEEARG